MSNTGVHENMRQDQPIFSGIPMELEEMKDRLDLVNTLPKNAQIVTLEHARASLDEAQRILSVLQSMSDEAHDLTDELELVLETLPMNHPHVAEVAEQLAQLVHQWQSSVSRLEGLGARIVSIDPGRIDWYGVVDHHVALFSWHTGEEDIEWYYHVDEGFSCRKPLIEA